jgi:hypothetical protein
MPNFICSLLCTIMLLSWQETVDAFSPSTATKHQYQGRKTAALRWVNDEVVTHTPELAPKDNSPRMTAMERAVDCAEGLIECDIDDEEEFINGKQPLLMGIPILRYAFS